MDEKFQSGYLGVGDADSIVCLSAPANFQRPRHIDSIGYCTPIEDQAQTSECAAFSLTSVIEADNWKKNHFYKHLDPHALYVEAKRIDGNNTPGTYLTSAFQAAKNLGYLEQNRTLNLFRTIDDLVFALHTNQIVWAAFMIDDGWMKANPVTGIIPHGLSKLGGHAVHVPYYEKDRWLGVGNSWGTKWGLRGFGRMGMEQAQNQFMEGAVIL